MTTRNRALAGLASAALLICSLTTLAADFSWLSATGGNWSDTTNWTPNGEPNTTSDTATITAAGPAYTVTVNAARAIDSLTMDSADVTLDASSTLQFSGANGTAAFSRGAIKGTFTFDEDGVGVTVDKANVSIGGVTRYQFRRAATGGTKALTFNAGDLAATETLDILATDGPHPRGMLSVTTTNGYTNDGPLSVRTTGNDYGGGVGTVTYTVTNGTLTNNGSVALSNGGTTAFQASAILNADLTNNAGASLTADALLPQFTSGRVYLTRVGGTYINRGSWTVTGAGGMYVTGDGVTFTQDAASAQLFAVNSILNLANSSGTKNTVSITNGSVNGNFEFHGTDLTLGANRTVAGPTTWTLVRAGTDGASPAPPFAYYNYNGTLTLDEIRSNETLQVSNSNVGGYGYRAYASITQSGGFVNDGTISIQDNMSYHDNPDRSELVVSGGTLTNRGQLNLTDISSGTADGARLTAPVINEATGTITLSETGNGQTRLGAAGHAHVNRGMIQVDAGTRNFVNGASFTNETGGTITVTGAAALDVTGVTGGLVNNGGFLGGIGSITGNVLNNGTASPGSSAGAMTVAGNYTQGAAGVLEIEIGGTVQGSDYDVLTVTGATVVDGTLSVELINSFLPGALDSFVVLDATAGLNGSFSNVSGGLVDVYEAGSLAGWFQVTMDLVEDDVILSSFLQVPEPASIFLLALAAAAIGCRRRRKNTAVAALAVTMVALMAAVPASHAAAVGWNGLGDGSSFGASQGGANLNWDSGVTPSNLDDITINPSATTSVNYNTAIFPAPANGTTGPRTLTVGNSGAGTTTVNVTADLYSRVTNSPAINALTVNAGGVWQHASGTEYHNDHVLIDGGALLVQGGVMTAGAWPSGNPFRVTNGGTVNVTAGQLNWGGTGVVSIIGETGTGAVTLGVGATPSNSTPYLQVGNGTTGTGTVNWNATAAGNSAMRQLDLQNGSVTIASGAGTIFVSTGRTGRANIEVGTSTGTAVLNKNNATFLGGDRNASTLELLRVGPNGTVNWADGDILSNASDNRVINDGVFNFTRTSGTSNLRYGPIFENTGTLNWTGAAGINLNPANAQGNGDFQNDGTLVITGTAQRTLFGDLILGSTGTLALDLGALTTTGLLVSGANGGNIIIDGALEYTEAAGFQKFVSYDILTSSLGGAGITFTSLSLPPGIALMDDGTLDGSLTIQAVPEPASLALLLGLAVIGFRRRR